MLMHDLGKVGFGNTPRNHTTHVQKPERQTCFEMEKITLGINHAMPELYCVKSGYALMRS
jgi:hypothetical protein